MAHPKMIENLLEYSPQERVDYFVRYCADFKAVWGIVVEQDNWVIFKDTNFDEIFPVWPSEDIASACMFTEHEEMGATPQLIKLDSFLANCVPDMEEQNISFGVFIDKQKTGLILKPTTLGNLLVSELDALQVELPREFSGKR